MIYFLLLTAFTVSIDSFACGLSLSLENTRKKSIVLIIAFTVFLMCLAANYLPYLFADFNGRLASVFGGVLLLAVGIFNLFKKEKDHSKKNGSYRQCFFIGFAVGIDGALANFSLSIMNINGFYVPVIIAVMHAIMIALGCGLSGTKIIKSFNKINFFAPLILILLGIYKIILA